MQRLQLKIFGIVQGVGFRPYVYRLATELNLSGFIKNDPYGVHIEIQGTECPRFLSSLTKDLPPLARIDSIVQKEMALKKSKASFAIHNSLNGIISSKIPADAAVCDDCLDDLFNRNSPFYYYPFVQCTHCGPRYSLTWKLPYDRKHTSLSIFEPCTNCSNLYDNPNDRRYHAETIACAQCGPNLSHSINDMATVISQGQILALKSIGGYQLICDARNEAVLQKLRLSKARLHKPFALMVLNTASAKKIVACSKDTLQLLNSPERPIIVLDKVDNSLPSQITPGLNTLGVMLAYTPAHYLLFHALLGSPARSQWLQQKNNLVLVVTSANSSDSPIIKDNKVAEEELHSIADCVVHYNRDISTALDDSVVQFIAKKPAFIRRARGYVPNAITLPYAIPTTLALGGYLKNTVCVTRGNEAFVSQPVGSLNTAESIAFYHDTIKHLLKILNVKPDCVAHDKHPDFYSTQIAAQFKTPSFAIQHHHAHLAACAVEHGITTPALGLALDGFGLGDDGENWGGELMFYHGNDYKRLGSLQPLLQPGGDTVVKQPWRMAVSALFAVDKQDLALQRFSHYPQTAAILSLLKNSAHVSASSSCGRLFDAASSLLGICENADYEGQAAMMMESCVSKIKCDPKGWILTDTHLNLLPLLNMLLSCDPTEGANLFHGTLAAALVSWVEQAASQQGLEHVLLSGGCFLNRVLSNAVIAGLEKKKLTPLYPYLYPPNDSGLSLGQAWLGGNEMMARKNVCPSL
jgi:hydrogenase maturation protein HypF